MKRRDFIKRVGISTMGLGEFRGSDCPPLLKIYLNFWKKSFPLKPWERAGEVAQISSNKFYLSCPGRFQTRADN